jgi:hypothetical protein
LLFRLEPANRISRTVGISRCDRELFSDALVGGLDVRVLSFRRGDCLGRVRGLNDESAAFFRCECERRLYCAVWRIDGGVQHGGVVDGLVGDVVSGCGTEQRGVAGPVLSPIRAWRTRFFDTDRGFHGRRVHSGGVHETLAKMDCDFWSRPDWNWDVELVQLGFSESVLPNSTDDFPKPCLDDRSGIRTAKKY